VPPYRRRLGQPRRTGNRRRTLWSTTNINNVSLATGTNGTPTDLLFDLANLQGVGVIGGTILRTHLIMSFSSLLTDTSPAFNFGIVVYDQVPINSSGIKPDPQTEVNLDWMIDKFISPGTGLQSVDTSSTFLYGDRIDLKAKRRIHEVNNRPFLCVKNIGNATASYSAWCKMLIALP